MYVFIYLFIVINYQDNPFTFHLQSVLIFVFQIDYM